MSQSTTTTVIVPGRSPMTNIPGVRNETWVRNTYGSELNLTGLQATERDEAGVHIVEFKQRTGTKG